MEIPGEKLKLSNVWTNFDEFEDLCLVSGKIATKDRMKTIRKTMFENNVFVSDWHKLLNSIIWIFVNDTKIAKKFDYSKAFMERNQEIFKKISLDSRELTQGLFDKLSNNSRFGQDWNTATKHYSVTDSIYIKKLLKKSDSPFVTITGNLLDLDNFYVNFNDLYKIHIIYNNGKYVRSINTETNRSVIISKYTEIPAFINARYFNKLLTNLNFTQFCYIIKSFCLLTPNIRVPNMSNGYLSSVQASQTLKNIEETMEYCEKADKRLANIAFTYCMVDYNRFEIKRATDEKLQNNIAEIENQWGDKRARFPLSPKATGRTILDKKQNKE